MKAWYIINLFPTYSSLNYPFECMADGVIITYVSTDPSRQHIVFFIIGKKMDKWRSTIAQGQHIVVKYNSMFEAKFGTF